MKYKLFIIISIIFSFVILSCAEKEESTTSDVDSWTGTKQIGTGYYDSGTGIATDSSGNIYVTGTTFGGLDGNTNAGLGYHNDLIGGGDMFLIKYDSSGTKQWTKQIGTSTSDSGDGVATDSSGNVYVTGNTSEDLDGNTNAGYRDIFVVKYDSSGTKQWTKQFGTADNDSAFGVATDSSANVYVTGYTEGGLDGNTNAGDEDNNSIGANFDMFLVKYDSSGTKQWTQQLGTSNMDVATGVATDSSDNVYVTGYTRGGLDGNTIAGWQDMFLVKYDSSGTKQWTQQLGTESEYGRLLETMANGVATDSSDNVYVAGYTKGHLDGNTNVGRESFADIFLVKYDSSGTKQWTKQLGTEYYDLANAVATDSSGNIYVTGITPVHDILDGNTVTDPCWVPEPWTCNDMFVVKYDSSGTKQWTVEFGTDSKDEANGIATDFSGNIYVTGETVYQMDSNMNAGPEGTSDMFLVKYNSSGTFQSCGEMEIKNDGSKGEC
jgi:hypothetical protein